MTSHTSRDGGVRLLLFRQTWGVKQGERVEKGGRQSKSLRMLGSSAEQTEQDDFQVCIKKKSERTKILQSWSCIFPKGDLERQDIRARIEIRNKPIKRTAETAEKPWHNNKRVSEDVGGLTGDKPFGNSAESSREAKIFTGGGRHRREEIQKVQSRADLRRLKQVVVEFVIRRL